MADVVILSGGSPHAHDFPAIGAALAALFSAEGHDVLVVDHPESAVMALDEHRAKALVVAGLWWRMLGDSYDRWRGDYAYSPPDTTRGALTGFVENGGGLVAVHTAPICFDDWPGWGKLVGGAWDWGVSSHPPYGPVTARIVATHPVVDGSPTEIALDDEVYGDLRVADDVTTLAVARRAPDDAEQPVVWAHHNGSGRVVFNGFGHDAASIRHPDNARILVQALRWVLEAA